MKKNISDIDVGYVCLYCPEINPQKVIFLKKQSLLTIMNYHADSNKGKGKKIKFLFKENEVVSAHTLNNLRYKKCSHLTYEKILVWLFEYDYELFKMLDVKFENIKGLKLNMNLLKKYIKSFESRFFEQKNGVYIYNEASFEFLCPDTITRILSSLNKQINIK